MGFAMRYITMPVFVILQLSYKPLSIHQRHAEKINPVMDLIKHTVFRFGNIYCGNAKFYILTVILTVKNVLLDRIQGN